MTSGPKATVGRRQVSLKNLNFVALLAVGMIFANQRAEAAFVLTLDDLSTFGIDVIVVDDAPVGTVTKKGLSTTLDAFAGLGTASFIGAVGTFSVNVTTGISKPAIGPAIIDLNSVTVSSAGSGGGVLEIMLTDTGFTFEAGNSGALLDVIGGTTRGIVTSFATYDGGDMEFAIASGGPVISTPVVVNTAVPLGTPTGFTSTTQVGIPLIAATYSLSKFVRIEHFNSGDISSFNNEASIIVPEPGTLALLIGAVPFGLCLVLRRRAQIVES